jgi:hypothetical protein
VTIQVRVSACPQPGPAMWNGQGISLLRLASVPADDALAPGVDGCLGAVCEV